MNLDHEIKVQQQMVYEMNQLPDGHGGFVAGGKGWNYPCGRDPWTREPLTLGMMYDRYAVCLCVVQEKCQ